MLLTITYKGNQTQDLGYLLHKNPYRAQSFDLNFGKVYVFYPEISDESTTAAIALSLLYLNSHGNGFWDSIQKAWELHEPEIITSVSIHIMMLFVWLNRTTRYAAKACTIDRKRKRIRGLSETRRHICYMV